MEEDPLLLLESIGVTYNGPTNSLDTWMALIEKDVNIDFANFVHRLSTELQKMCKFEECVHKIDGVEDVDSFYLELTSLLREMNCPYTTLTDGNLAKNLNSADLRLLLLNYLIGELQAAFMTAAQSSAKIVGPSNVMNIAESDTAAVLRLMLTSLGFPKPPPNITAQQLFSKVAEKLKEQLGKAPKNVLSDPLFTGILSDKQWRALQNINQAMTEEYKDREDVLLKRLDVTMQSFSWSDRIKKFEEKLRQIYEPARRQLTTTSKVQLADLLAARSDLLEIDKTSGVSVRSKTKSKINEVIMRGRVPDRGGRPTEIEPPPPEMPPWQKRTPGGGAPQGARQFSGRGDGRSGGGGGRVQSSWNPPSHADSWGHGQPQQYGAYGQQQSQYGYGGGRQQQQAYYGQQQGAAYYQDYYGTAAGGQHQQQYYDGRSGQGNEYYDRSGPRGGRGRGGGYYR